MTDSQADAARMAIVAKLHGRAMLQLRANKVPLGLPSAFVAGTFGLGHVPPTARASMIATLSGESRPLTTLKASQVVGASASAGGIKGAFKTAGQHEANAAAAADAMAAKMASSSGGGKEGAASGSGGSRRRNEAGAGGGGGDGEGGKKKRRRSAAAGGGEGEEGGKARRRRRRKGEEEDVDFGLEGEGAREGAGAGGGDEEGDDEGGDAGPDDGNVDYCCTCEEAGDLLCCDVCPRSYHPACLKLKIDELGEGEWMCPECIKTFGPNKERLSSMDGPIVTAPFYDGSWTGPKASAGGREAELLAIVKTLQENEFAVSFTEPVPAALKDYHKAIPRAMDLGCLYSRLAGKATWGGSAGAKDAYKASQAAAAASSRRGRDKDGDRVESGFYYGTGDDFDAPRAITDLRLVWSNCKTYNKPMSTIWRMADLMSRETETMLRDRIVMTSGEAGKLRTMTQAECTLENLHESE